MEKLSYEQASKELEKIVGTLEEGNIPLEKAVEYFEKGKELSLNCFEVLKAAKGKLTEIDEVLGKLVEEDV